MKQLNVEIPRPPVVCVDSLGRNHVAFHWDSTNENVFYAVMVNGKDVGTLARTQVRLSHLIPDFVYSIQVLAVDVVTNYVAQSEPVYVHTSGGKNGHFLPASARKIALDLVPQIPAIPRGALDLTAADVDNITKEEQLVAYLASFQNELKKTSADHEAQTALQHAEEARLRSEISACKGQLNAGLDFRAKKDLDLKLLEKQKDLLTFTKLKLAKQLRTLENNRQLHWSRLADLRLRVAKLREKHHHAVINAGTERRKVNATVDEAAATINTIKADTAALEETLRELSLEKRALLAQIHQLRLLLYLAPSQNASVSEDIHLLQQQQQTLATNEIFTRDGSLTKNGAQIFNKICSLLPEWLGDLQRELEILQGLDNSWKDVFREAVASYVVLFNATESARAQIDPLYDPQLISEHVASIQFAGYANALPKPPNTRKKPIPLLFDGSLSPSPPPPESILRGFYSSPSNPNVTTSTGATGATGVGGGSDSIASPGLMPAPLVLTPQSLNALMVALHHQFGANSGAGNSTSSGVRVALDYGGLNHGLANVFTSPNNSFTDADAQQSLEPAPSSWLHSQTYPVLLNQAQLQAQAQAQAQAQSQVHAQTQARYMEPALGFRGHSMPFAPETSIYTQNAAYAPPSAPQPYLGDFQDQQVYTPEIHQPTPTNSMHHYAQNIRQNFPYAESLYQPSPGPEQAYLAPQTSNSLAPSLWNNSSQSSFLENRRAFQDYSVNAEPLHPSVSQQSNLSSDAGLINNILLPSASHYSSTNSIWLDRYIGNNYGHNRAVSSGSQLWRNEGIRREKSPNSGFVSDFLPFSLNTLPSQNGYPDAQDQQDYDIRLL